MSFTKQTPTKPGDYRWRPSVENQQKRFATVENLDGKLFVQLCGNPNRYRVEGFDGEWEGPLVTEDEAQADAAAMREALESLVRFRCECRGDNKCGHCKARAALSGDAGLELLAKLQRLRDELKTAREEAESAKAARNASGVVERKKYLPTIQQLTDELAKAKAQIAELRSEVEKAYEKERYDEAARESDWGPQPRPAK